MIDACKANGVELMVGYRLHFDEATLQAFEIARTGKLGDLRAFSSFLSHRGRLGDATREPYEAGGATYNLGVDCINAARNLFRLQPTEVVAQASFDQGADDTLSAILRFPGERV